MHPSELKAASFTHYPPQAQALATANLSLLQTVPLPLLPILLRELIAYDWKLPAERRELQKQFTFLSQLAPNRRADLLNGFDAITLDSAIAATDWVNQPSEFMEKLTAELWSTHQMDRFRTLADSYADALNAALAPAPPAQPRLAVVIVGAGVETSATSLFRKLRPHGLYLSHIDPKDGLPHILAEASRRAQRSPSATRHPDTDPSFLHWTIDGGSHAASPGLTNVSYTALEHPRALLLGRIQQAIGTGTMGPEALRSLLARLKPSDIGLGGSDAEATSGAVLDHFQMSLMTEGAGTQIFATTFVQWAARECIRRAQPETLIVRYAPRQQVQTMNLMLAGVTPKDVDLEGSLIDADLGAYYAWLAMRRLSGSDQMRFMAWFEAHGEAIAIGPGLPQGTTSASQLNMKQVLAMLS